MLNQNQISQILKITKEAGAIILPYFENQKELNVEIKNDQSPVTAADLAANDLIISKLTEIFPDIAIVSEEKNHEENLKAAAQKSFFAIDPLDGTSAFIRKSGEFSVNIALVENFKVVFGAIYLPAKDLMFFSNHQNKAVKIAGFSKENYKEELINVSKKQNNLKIICTHRQPEKSQILQDLAAKNLQVEEIISVNSSYKFCLIAQGAADYYPRKANICAWDIAAGHAIVKAAKGNVFCENSKEELTYQFKQDFKMPFFQCY
jgi:3'(2'), 5'-bisphosphate nucleotidase